MEKAESELWGSQWDLLLCHIPIVLKPQSAQQARERVRDLGTLPPTPTIVSTESERKGGAGTLVFEAQW